jgi:predicted dehydrogenase
LINFSVIGVNHSHIYGQVNALLNAGARFVSFYAPEPEWAAPFSKAFPQATQVHNEDEILEDWAIHMIVTAGVPYERAPLGIRAMQHGKDFMTDKPGFTTLDQLAEVRRVQAETKRIYSVCYSERFENGATTKAGELVQAGAIGRVIQTIGLGPHRANLPSRPAWFFEREKYGGILCDIGSHQADQFLFFTGSTEAEVVASQVGNFNHPQHPELEDFGDVIWRGNGAPAFAGVTGYARVDWFTPDGLATWGDGRLTILGTQGYIELRKYIDLAGRPGGSHLFIADRNEMRYVDCSNVDLPYGRQLVHDVLDRTETAMSQTHCFLASELVLKAQAMARRIA